MRILKFVAVDDAGGTINPSWQKGRSSGRSWRASVKALVEEAVYDDTGQLVTGTFADYAMLARRTRPR